MKKRKLTAFMMAVLMTVMLTPAFAAESNTNTRIEATCLLPDVITVIVPAEVDAMINPYDMEVGFSPTYLGITSAPASIHNLSAVPVNVSVTATGTVNEGSNMTLVGVSTTGSTSTAKRAFVYYEIQAVDAGAVEELEGYTDPIDFKYWSGWDSEFDAEKHLIVRTTPKVKKNIVTLAAGDEKAPEDSKCYGTFRLSGDCIRIPKGGWNTAVDGFEVRVAFTFTRSMTGPD